MAPGIEIAPHKNIYTISPLVVPISILLGVTQFAREVGVFGWQH